jgi:hypothetical protein
MAASPTYAPWPGLEQNPENAQSSFGVYLLDDLCHAGALPELFAEANVFVDSDVHDLVEYRHPAGTQIFVWSRESPSTATPAVGIRKVIYAINRARFRAVDDDYSIHGQKFPREAEPAVQQETRTAWEHWLEQIEPHPQRIHFNPTMVYLFRGATFEETDEPKFWYKCRIVPDELSDSVSLSLHILCRQFIAPQRPLEFVFTESQMCRFATGLAKHGIYLADVEKRPLPPGGKPCPRLHVAAEPESAAAPLRVQQRCQRCQRVIYQNSVHGNGYPVGTIVLTDFTDSNETVAIDLKTWEPEHWPGFCHYKEKAESDD